MAERLLPSGTAGAPAAALKAEVTAWLAQDPDPATVAELQALLDAGAWDELANRFGGRLSFGTAGLRAELGAGPLRMNRLVVRQAAAGFLHYLIGQSVSFPPLLVVGHDARHGSAAFAADSAGVAAALGVNVVWFDRPIPTPVLAFAVRRLEAAGGVMVTASHNPAADNGYKVYLDDGAQIIPPHDERIAAAIDAVAAAGPPPWVAPPPPIDPAELIEAYLDAIVGQLVAPTARAVRIAYTPLCGVGGEVAGQAFARAGFPAPVVVASQARPDPAFPGLPFPNPEEPGVLDAALALARQIDADVVLANDPDADRLGVAVRGQAPGGSAYGGDLRVLSGNEIGALLADHLLAHSAGPDRLVVSSLVSSRLVERMARAAGVHFQATLTGFKWIVRPALTHPEWRFVFGFEEALGFAAGNVVADKDGISAALLFAELTAELAASGSTPLQRLDELAARFGLHATDQWSIRFPDREQGVAQAAALMTRVRATQAGPLGAWRVTDVWDLAGGGRGLAPADVVVWDLEGGPGPARVVFRPSGTEPKLKIYLEVVIGPPCEPAPARAEAALALAALRAELAAVVGLPPP